MGYHALDPDVLPETPDRPCSRRTIGEAVGLESVSVNRYDAEPGEQIPLAYHSHDEQEELLYVLSGTLYVETPEREYVIREGEVFVAEPESPHRAYNPISGIEPVSVLAVGAPRVDDARRYDPQG
ncbi:cupin domain-containing protein [Natronorarus salvus]|uniref:cupin domain-containing protein n=1 Tax=Natronorarus salvus TaxID=3117733 RepID=UPI002F2609CE